MLAGKFLHGVGKTACVIQWCENFQMPAGLHGRVMLLDQKIVFLAMTWCDVDTPRSLLQRDKVGE